MAKLPKLSAAQIDDLRRRVLCEEMRRKGIPWTKYIPHEPTEKQLSFLGLKNKEAFYGGAGGGGKSDALLMGALQHVDIPGYAAILFRKTFRDLSKPGCLIPRSHEWLAGTDAKWNEKQYEWTFPSGAKLSFGYLDTVTDHFNYQGAEFQYIGFDELTHHTEYKYTYLFSRLRSKVTIPVPLRMRATSNPGGVGHKWVKRRFVSNKTRAQNVAFIPAKVDDNPHINREDYKDSLSHLDEITRAQMLAGDWDITDDNLIVYSPFDRDMHMIEPPSYDPDFYGVTVAGVDPGTSDPYAVSIWAREKSGKGWWKLDEFYKTGGTSNGFAPEFRKLQDVYKCRRWYVDKRRIADIIDLRKAGLPAVPNLEYKTEEGRGTIRPMIGVVLDIMKHDEFHVSPRCKWTALELESYQYPDREGKNSGENPVDNDNHLMDADRYALCSVEDIPKLRARYRQGQDLMPRERPKIQTGPFKMPTAQEALAAQAKRMDDMEQRRFGRRR